MPLINNEQPARNVVFINSGRRPILSTRIAENIPAIVWKILRIITSIDADNCVSAPSITFCQHFSFFFRKKKEEKQT